MSKRPALKARNPLARAIRAALFRRRVKASAKVYRRPVKGIPVHVFGDRP